MQSQMFFTGEWITRKRVSLRGRSPKEMDSDALIKKAQLDRCRRLQLRKKSAAALTIQLQKCFRARRAVRAARSLVRDQFCGTYGKHCQNVDRDCFGPDSGFLRQLCFFFNAKNTDDFSVLVETCRLLQHFAQESVAYHTTGNVVSLFAGTNYSLNRASAEYRVQQLAFACVQAIHQNRNNLKDQLLATSEEYSLPTTILLQAVLLLIDPERPWASKVVDCLIQRNLLTLLGEIILAVKASTKGHGSNGTQSLVEAVLTRIASHIAQKLVTSRDTGAELSFCFSSQILTVPFLWQLFPYLKDFVSTRLSQHYISQMALFAQNHANKLPSDVATEFPGCAYVLGNVLEIAALALDQCDCSVEKVLELVAFATLLEDLPPRESRREEKGGSRESSTLDGDEIIPGDEVTVGVLHSNLKEQINNAIYSCFLLQLNKVLSKGPSFIHGSENEGPDDDKKLQIVAAACAFLHATFNTKPPEQIVNVLASRRNDLVLELWNFVKWCYDNRNCLTFLPLQFSHLLGNTPWWLLPLAVFCPVYRYMLMIVDDEEFYEQEKPLSLEDVKCLIEILTHALWQLLWENPTAQPNPAKSASDSSLLKRQPVEIIQIRITTVVSELHAQLQDWNNRSEFTSPSDFHVNVGDCFISQAAIEGTQEHDILNQAPFLIPFTSRFKIFTAQLAVVKQRHRACSTGNRFRIRRNHIWEDACNQMSALSEENLQGLIHITFVNIFGVEEPGIDEGGIFKDFMDNITRVAFDVQYGLFKETADHLLYPSPGSGMIHDQHLQFYHILGTLLAKAMFEEIRVDLPFATFFLSKLKQKYNYLNDLSSLDREFYDNIISLKNNNERNISELGLDFTIVNNEYGEQAEEELVPGGKNLRVTEDNFIEYIYLVSNHRLNIQIQKQSSHFLRGFLQLMQRNWINMFSEDELQLLISGSSQSLDVDDLQRHTNYTSGYHSEHHVIKMFWEVLKSFSLEDKKKFLKFVTGSSRGPLLGFKYLESEFTIQRAAGSATEEVLDRLPTARTCFNRLELPPYRSKEDLEKKLLYAINAEAGFDLG
ncbi:hypothetical protein SLEP1_g38439 [Rubroshorea leprosula]|nr:hypothetical protein SLEP1_g38439 [Rubroshorea leprosula]